MPKQIRFKTNYVGVSYINGTSQASNKTEKIYYIRYRLDGKYVEEKAGRQYNDNMTPAKASRIRALRIEGKQLPNVIKREHEEIIKTKNIWIIDKLWDEFYLQKKQEGLKSQTDDVSRYNNYIRPKFGKKEPNELTVLEIDKLRLELLNKLKPNTVKNILILLKRIINFGFNKQLIPPISFKIQMPKVDNMKTESLTQDQLNNLLEVLDNEQNSLGASIMKLALFTGMRKSEIFNLKWEDIDYNQGFILIRDPKGGKEQKIPLNKNAISTFNAQIKTDSSYVFPGRSGGKLTDARKSINHIRKLAGFPDDFRPLHGLRHVYASLLASSGKVDMYTLQKLLTHKSPQMTQRYAHLHDDALKKGSSVIDEIFNNNPK